MWGKERASGMIATLENKNAGELRRNRIVWTFRICATVFALLLCGLLLTACDQKPKAAPLPAPPPPPPEVATVAVVPQTLVLTAELPGRTSPYLIAEVRPQASGLIKKSLFTEGANVKAGQVLYEIDSAPFKAAQERAAANLEALRKDADRAKTFLSASIASVTQQKATVALAHMNRQRFEILLKDKAISASDSDQAVARADVAEVTLKATEAQVQRDRAAVAAAEAEVQRASAALEALRNNLSYSQITAPISGRIGKSAVTNDTLVTDSHPIVLTTIQQIDPIYVDVPQSTADLRLQHRLDEGEMNSDGTGVNNVQLLLEDGAKYPLEGAIQFRDASAEPTTRSAILRMVFPNPNGVLQPGMFVRAVVKDGVNEHAILIPRQAVSRNPKGEPMALIVSGEEIVQQRMITLNRMLGDQWLVSSGLQPGDRVITEGAQQVRPGAKVKAVEFNPFLK